MAFRPPRSSLILGGVLILMIGRDRLCRRQHGECQLARAEALIDDLESKSQGFVDKVAGATFADRLDARRLARHRLAETGSGDGLRPDRDCRAEIKNLGGGVLARKCAAGRRSRSPWMYRFMPPGPTSAVAAGGIRHRPTRTSAPTREPVRTIWSGNFAAEISRCCSMAKRKILTGPPAFHPGRHRLETA